MINMENKKKESLFRLLHDPAAFARFEILEHYTDFVESEEDIGPLQEVLTLDPDPIVRHEAAAQLLKIETKRPELTANLKQQIQSALVKSIHEDSSVIVRHEAMEALAYIGNEDALPILQGLVNDSNSDIKCTALIARDILLFRLKHSLKGSELCGSLMTVTNQTNKAI